MPIIIDRFIARVVGYTAPPPRTIFLIVNEQCNARCLMCDVGQRNPNSQFTRIMQRGEMPLNLLKNLLQEVKPWKPNIAITSTEPLLWSNLIQAINMIKDAGLSINITTNGILLPHLADKLLDKKVDSICVSLDGPANIHDTIRGFKGAFDKAIEGIKMIISGRKKNETSLRVNSTISPLNQKYIYEIANIVNKLGIDDHSFTHLNFITAEMAKLHNILFPKYKATMSSVTYLDPRSVKPAILLEQIRLVQNNYPNVKFTPNLNSIKEIHIYYHEHNRFVPGYSKCKAVWRVAQVAADGFLFGSTRCFDFPLGNIYKGFLKTWNGEIMRRFRRDLIDAGGAFPACARCCGVF